MPFGLVSCSNATEPPVGLSFPHTVQLEESQVLKLWCEPIAGPNEAAVIDYSYEEQKLFVVVEGVSTCTLPLPPQSQEPVELSCEELQAYEAINRLQELRESIAAQEPDFDGCEVLVEAWSQYEAERSALMLSIQEHYVELLQAGTSPGEAEEQCSALLTGQGGDLIESTQLDDAESWEENRILTVQFQGHERAEEIYLEPTLRIDTLPRDFCSEEEAFNRLTVVLMLIEHDRDHGTGFVYDFARGINPPCEDLQTLLTRWVAKHGEGGAR